MVNIEVKAAYFFAGMLVMFFLLFGIAGLLGFK